MNNYIKCMAVFAVLVLTGCSSSEVKNQVIPDSEFTVEEVYSAKVGSRMHADVTSVVRRAPSESEVAFDPYLNTGTSKVKYRMIPNPTLYIYFPPSVSGDSRMPTPGWMTEIKMYDRDEYAKPGETYLEGGR